MLFFMAINVEITALSVETDGFVAARSRSGSDTTPGGPYKFEELFAFGAS